jgi:hypothetical protein
MIENIINGSGEETGDGESLYTAFTKINNNFEDIDTNKISISGLQTIVADSTDFTDFQQRIAAL